MKRIIFIFMFVVAIAHFALCEERAVPIRTHQTGGSSECTEWDRCPINLPIAVFYDSDTDILEVWCDDDNIQAEVFVYDVKGDLEAYSPYMNVELTLTSSSSHSIRIIGDGWEAEGEV